MQKQYSNNSNQNNEVDETEAPLPSGNSGLRREWPIMTIISGVQSMKRSMIGWNEKLSIQLHWTGVTRNVVKIVRENVSHHWMWRACSTAPSNTSWNRNGPAVRAVARGAAEPSMSSYHRNEKVLNSQQLHRHQRRLLRTNNNQMFVFCSASTRFSIHRGVVGRLVLKRAPLLVIGMHNDAI